MPARKPGAGARMSLASPMEEHAAKLMRGTTPWIVWLLAIPLASLTLWGAGELSHHVTVVAVSMMIGTVIVSAVTWHSSHAKGWGRIHHGLNALAGMGIITLFAWKGPAAFGGMLAISYLVSGLIACIVWNVRYTQQHDGTEDVIKPARKDRRKKVDGAYMVRVLAGRAPVIRLGAEKAGKIVPALASPWREAPKAITGDGGPLAIEGADAADHVSADAADRAAVMAGAIRRNFRDLAAHKIPDLNGAKLRMLDVKPWRIRTEVILVKGIQTPKVIIDIREQIASQNALPLASIVASPSRARNDRVFLDFVLDDTLGVIRWWPGPSAAGQSIAAAPVRFGLYEDRVYAERFGPAITTTAAKKLGRAEKNLSHLLAEGMNGAGKSSAFRVLVTDGVTRIDVEDWLIDTVKKLQTFGQLAEAFEWFATTIPEARSLVRFLADVVIPMRADYLGSHGYDNWEEGCGLPYLRVWVEEGGIVANELDKLDHVLNSARSAGVEINLSVQRAHHALVDTNVRAAFGDTMSFGCKSTDDIFAMPDDLRDAGADPSQWANKQPGKNYYAGSDLDQDRQMMPDRAFNVDAAGCREIIAQYAPQRRAWIAANCPDWARLLEAADRNKAWTERTTGAAVLAKITATEARKLAAVPDGAEPAEPYEPPVLAEDDEILEGEIVTDDKEEPVTVDELDLDPEILQGVAEDEGVDPRSPMPPFDPADALQFPVRQQDGQRGEALAVMRSFLLQKGDGFEFAPRDVYDELVPLVGRSAGWVRDKLSILADEGLLEHDRAEGRYRVLPPRLRVAG